MFNRDRKFVCGFLAGEKDKDAEIPFDSNWTFTGIDPVFQKGYTAGYEGIGSVVIEMPDEIPACLSVSNRVRYNDHTTIPFLLGTIEGIGTECGPDYISVRWDENKAFCCQVHKDNLIKVD